MHLDRISKIIQEVVLNNDLNNIINNVLFSDDPDFVPVEDSIPTVTFAFTPAPFQRVYDEVLTEIIFWYSNPLLSKISSVVDEIEKSSETWLSFNENGSEVGRYRYLFNRSPSSGGRINLKTLTVYMRFKCTFHVC